MKPLSKKMIEALAFVARKESGSVYCGGWAYPAPGCDFTSQTGEALEVRGLVTLRREGSGHRVTLTTSGYATHLRNTPTRRGRS